MDGKIAGLEGEQPPRLSDIGISARRRNLVSFVHAMKRGTWFVVQLEDFPSLGISAGPKAP